MFAKLNIEEVELGVNIQVGGLEDVRLLTVLATGARTSQE
jgi:hypothetical protein